MKIPRKFLLNGEEWHVVWVRPDPQIDGVHGAYGMCDVATHTIYMDPRLNGKNDEEKWDTFFHELLHAIDIAESGVHRRLTGYWWLPHSVITRIANPLARWFIENRAILEVGGKRAS